MEMIETVADPMDKQAEYARLINDVLPSVIQSEEQNEAYIQRLAELLRREPSLTESEKRFAKLLTLLIEDFEENAYGLSKAGPQAAIRFLMDQHRMKQKDIAPIFGTASIVSEVLSGKRKLNYEQIRRLSTHFGVSPEIFF